jgi:hypothetical protein
MDKCPVCKVGVFAHELGSCVKCYADRPQPFDLPRATFTREPAQIRIASLEKRLRQIDDERARVKDEIDGLKMYGE